MRPVTRNVVVAILVVLVGLLALGALPSYLRSGQPYHVEATAVDGGHAAVNVSSLSARRYPYVTGAVAAAGNGTGRSKPYWRGPTGFKDAFTHSPFDELHALAQQHPETADGDAVYVRTNTTTYRTAIVREAAR
ncbi:MAG: hypothetical protein ABEJ23_04525 [Haloarculaceae archaeon]